MITCRQLRRSCHVKGSKLHRAVSTVLDPRRALRELRKARRGYPAEGGRFFLHVTDLGFAFVWELTPQGHAFWSRLDRALHSHK